MKRSRPRDDWPVASRNDTPAESADASWVRVKARNDQIEAKFLVDKIDDYIRSKRNLLEIPQILSFGKVTDLKSGLTDVDKQINSLLQLGG